MILSSKLCVFHHLVKISDKIGKIGQLARPKCYKMVENDVKWVQIISRASFRGSGPFRIVQGRIFSNFLPPRGGRKSRRKLDLTTKFRKSRSKNDLTMNFHKMLKLDKSFGHCTTSKNNKFWSVQLILVMRLI